MNRILIFLGVFFMACSSDSEKENNKEEPVEDKPENSELVGTWRNNEIIVRMPDSTLRVGEEEWEEKLGIKPIVTLFKADSTFTSEYLTPEDSLLMTSSGTWAVEGDTLTMTTHGTTYKYYYSIDGDTVFFRGFLDWDQDGQANDHYVGKQVRQKPD